MLSPFAKAILKPIHSMLDSYLERIANQIRAGKTAEAIASIEDLRNALASLKKWVE